MSIRIDHSQDGNSLFENVYITGLLDYDFSGDSLKVSNLEIDNDFTIGKDLLVNKTSYFTGVGTFASDLDVLGKLDLDNLTIKKQFNVGIGGTVLTANTTNSAVGIGTTRPEYKLQINSLGTESVIVSTGGTVGIGSTDIFGWVTPQDGFVFEGPTDAGTSHNVGITTEWTCPPNVYSVSIVCIGGGGGGSTGTNDNSVEVSGGGGGGLAYRNNYAVTPGQKYLIRAGAGGHGGEGSASGETPHPGKEGGDSVFYAEATGNGIVCFGEGGEGGVSGGANAGGNNLIGDGGSEGGRGGKAEAERGAGGGGAAGYTGAGGKGGEEGSGDGESGSGGGAGGGAGAYNTDHGGGGGGGVGVYGKGSDGEGGSNSSGNEGGEGGSGGEDGDSGNPGGTGEHGGYYGGGGGSGADALTDEGGEGGRGVVRVIWGSGREYPSSLTGAEFDYGTTGFNPANGPLKLDVEGSVHISRHIYDSAGSPGDNNWWLKRDGTGIRWVAVDPERADGIFIQDDGTYIPSVGAAQSFSTLNFAQANSEGTGTDTLIPTVGSSSDDQGSAGIASITTQSLWGYNDDSDIYRMTNVGIGTTLPVASLQVGSASSAFAVSGFGSVGIGTTNPLVGLDVYYDTNLRSTLKVDDTSTFVGLSTFNSGLIIHSGVSTFVGFTTFSDIRVGGATTLTGITTSLSTLFTKQLSVTGFSTFNNDVNFIGDSYNAEWDKSENRLKFADEAKIVFGTGNDLQIYHTEELKDQVDSNGASIVDDRTSYINENGSGGLVFKSNGGDGPGAYQFFDQGWRPLLKMHGGTDARTLLYYSGLERLETTEAGIDITGHTETDTLRVSGVSTFQGKVGIGKTLELDSHIKDINDTIGVGAAKTDYRLASVGTGVSWRPSGVETKNAIWVSMNGMDTNSGLLEGDAKRTIGGAAAIAQAGDTIIVRSGVYYENNPVGLRTEVTVSGEDLRLVTVVPNNVNKDVFQVRAGCLVQNLNFAGQTSSTNHPNCGAVAFPPTSAGISGGIDYQAVTGYTELGPANQGPDRTDPTKGARYRSPYVRNCTNFMTGSVGMKINGDYVNAAFTGTNDLGQDLKSMVCDSFTQYNQAGIGVSLTNNAYAQLVSIFTIGCDIAIFAGSGGQCDLTNSNSSFGNFGLKADGIGDVEFTGSTDTASIAGQDTIAITNVKDTSGTIRKPFDGQGAYFKIDLDNYPDALGSGTITAPLQLIRSIDIVDGGSGYNPSSPPVVTIPEPQGPEAILPEFSANVGTDGSITSIDVISSGRNFLADQDFTVTFSSGDASAKVNIDPILFTVNESSEPDTVTGLTNVTFNEFIPYNLDSGVDVDFSRLSRIITSSHSFEYVGAGTDLNKANPFQGGEPIPENEIVAINGGQIPFTSTDQKGNFRIGEGLTIDQTTSTIRGRDFNRAIQAQLTPLILALR